MGLSVVILCVALGVVSAFGPLPHGHGPPPHHGHPGHGHRFHPGHHGHPGHGCIPHRGKRFSFQNISRSLRSEFLVGYQFG